MSQALGYLCLAYHGRPRGSAGVADRPTQKPKSGIRIPVAIIQKCRKKMLHSQLTGDWVMVFDRMAEQKWPLNLGLRKRPHSRFERLTI